MRTKQRANGTSPLPSPATLATRLLALVRGVSVIHYFATLYTAMWGGECERISLKITVLVSRGDHTYIRYIGGPGLRQRVVAASEWECHIYREKGKLDSALQSTQPPRLQWCALSVGFLPPLSSDIHSSGNSRPPDRCSFFDRRKRPSPQDSQISLWSRRHHETYVVHVSTSRSQRLRDFVSTTSEQFGAKIKLLLIRFIVETMSFNLK